MASLEKWPLYHLALGDSTYLKRLMRKVQQDNIKKSETIERYLKELVYLNTCHLNHKIPKQMVCLDEKYLRHCLEMIHISAAESGACTASLSASSLERGISLEGFMFPLAQNIEPFSSAGSFVKPSLPTSSENVNYSPPGHWIIGSINGSVSMKKILESPMFRRLVVLDDDKDDSDLDFLSSGSHSNICSTEKLHSNKVFLGDNIYGRVRQGRFNSMFGTNGSEEQIYDPGAVVSHGMLQCSLKDGMPHYIFSVDVKREVYEANLLWTKSSGNEGMQWMYSFNLHNGSRREGQAASTKKMSQVGTMKVSCNFTVCQNKFKMLETEFVLYAHVENSKDESKSSFSQRWRWNRGLSKKFTSTFKPSYSVRRRTNTEILTCPWPARTEVHRKLGASLEMTHTLENKTQPYCEIAAVIIRNHIFVQPQEAAIAETGGWGANILKRATLKETNLYQDQILGSKSQVQCSNRYCSTMDIIIPAGYHSLPETGGGLPSSLVERYKTGGLCDCGGWDLGCPFTIYNMKSDKQEVYAPNGYRKECISVDAVIQGKERNGPKLKMVNISSNLHYLKFESSLSALQCFSVAVAVLHCQNDTLQSKMAKELEMQSAERVL